VARAQLGPGYGATTPAAEAAVLACRAAGLALETTYTAKCMAEVLARLADGRARTPVLFWNTYNSADFWKTAPELVAEDRLPRAIQRWLAEASA
jgi:D-cysteine desulfhydrase